LHSLAFVIGFGAIFTLLGSAAGLLGQNLNNYLPLIQRLGAVLLAIFGLTTLGIIGWIVNRIRANERLIANPAVAALVDILGFLNALMYTERRVTELHKVKRGWGYLSSALMGVSFSAGWVPCVGPILGAILVLAATTASAATGAVLLTAYSLGIMLPFVLAGAFSGWTRVLLRRYGRALQYTSAGGGVLLIALGVIVFTNLMPVIASLVPMGAPAFG